MEEQPSQNGACSMEPPDIAVAIVTALGRRILISLRQSGGAPLVGRSRCTSPEPYLLGAVDALSHAPLSLRALRSFRYRVPSCRGRSHAFVSRFIRAPPDTLRTPRVILLTGRTPSCDTLPCCLSCLAEPAQAFSSIAAAITVVYVVYLRAEEEMLLQT